MTVTNTVESIRACLVQSLTPVTLEIRDDSAQHAGHAGAAGGGGHYMVHIVSDRFTGLRPLARHRLVYDAVASLMPARIHALSIRALTPEESEQQP